MNYKHTQIGFLTISIIHALVIYFGFLFFVTYELLILFFGILIIAILIYGFVTLHVSIDSSHLRVKFGKGIFIKEFLLSEVVSSKTVKNRWFYGWGIHVWFWPKMWIYNISGFDAVEIQLQDGKLFRIGTDQPEELNEAIIKSIKKS